MKKTFSVKLKSKKNTLKVALCAIGKWEEDYLVEWVKHYKSIGFDNIIFYDNNDEGDNGQYTILKQYIDNGFVIYHDCRKSHNNKQQKTSYKDAFGKYRGKYDWIAFFDVDEFLYLKDYKTIKNFLNSNETFKMYDAIHFKWVDYTDSGLLYSDKRDVKERFIETYDKSPKGNNIKSIVKTKNIKKLTPYCMHMLGVENACDANGEQVGEEDIRRTKKIYDNAYIKHYRFKSLEEYIIRYNKGSATGRAKHKKILYYIKENKYTYEKHKILYDKGILQDCLKNVIILKFQKKGLGINLVEPKSVLDKLNYLKIYDITKEKSMCSDKIYLHVYCKRKLGEDICVPILKIYKNINDLNLNKLPQNFVLKCNHGYKMNIICNKDNINIEECKEKIKKWLEMDFGTKSLQLHYSFIKPICYAEKYLGDNVTDYKVNCIHGEPQYIEVICDRGKGKTKYTTYDLKWNKITNPTITTTKYDKKLQIDKPLNLDKMIEYSKKLSEDFKFVRVDFYEVDGVLYLGELTFTPCNCNIESNGEIGNNIFKKLNVK